MRDRDPNDPLVLYISEIATIAPLARDEEMHLLRQLAQPGGWSERKENIARRLIEGHLAQVVSIAEKYADSSTTILDLIQEGNKGLLSAVQSFAERPGGDFAEYAAICIDEAIKKVLA